MAVQPERSERAGLDPGALEALADAGRAAARGGRLGDVLRAVVGAAAGLTGADVVLARIVDEDRRELVVRAVAGPSAALAVELEGGRMPLDDLPIGRGRARRGAGARGTSGRAPGGGECARRARRRGRRGARERRAAPDRGRLRRERPNRSAARRGTGRPRRARLRRGGAGGRQAGVPASRRRGRARRRLRHGPQLDARPAPRPRALRRRAGRPVAAPSWTAPPELDAAVGAADRGRRAPTVGVLQLGTRWSVTQQLGEPPFGLLELVFPPELIPSSDLVEQLSHFATRAAHALGASRRAGRVEAELVQTRALLAVVGQANQELSLEHTLETATEQLGQLVGAERLAVYLLDESGLTTGSGAGARRPAPPRRGGAARARAGAVSRARRRRDRRHVEGAPPRGRRGRARGSGNRERDRAAARGGRRGDRSARRLSDGAHGAECRRARAALGDRLPPRGRGPERAAARGGHPARSRAGAGARVRAGCGAPARGALRDLALVRAEPLARRDARSGRPDGRRAPRGRRGGAAHAGSLGASSCCRSRCTWRRIVCSHPCVRCSSVRRRSGARASNVSSATASRSRSTLRRRTSSAGRTHSSCRSSRRARLPRWSRSRRPPRCSAR